MYIKQHSILQKQMNMRQFQEMNINHRLTVVRKEQNIGEYKLFFA
jgi:hypothetical protein